MEQSEGCSTKPVPSNFGGSVLCSRFLLISNIFNN